MPSPGALATWENQIATRTEILTYTVGSDPQYYEIYLRLPPVVSLIDAMMPSGPLSERVLVDITYEVFVTDPDSLNSAGILAAELAYGVSTAAAVAPRDNGNNIPTLDPVGIPLRAEAYDPISLPVAGASFPIWTRAAIDPLRVTQFANDDDNPGPLWGLAFVQLNASLNGQTATVVHHLHWDFNVESTIRPLIGVP
jgi:hypothetical protein